MSAPSIPAKVQTPQIGIVFFCGTVAWMCRHCGSFNKRRVRGGTWKLRCSNRLCNRLMVFAAVEGNVPHGGRCGGLSRAYEKLEAIIAGLSWNCGSASNEAGEAQE